MSRKKDWSQALFDLMANEKVFLQVEGEVGEVDALLKVRRHHQWRDLAQVVAAETFEAAMVELMSQVSANWSAVAALTPGDHGITAAGIPFTVRKDGSRAYVGYGGAFD